MTKDSEIKQSVAQELKWDAKVRETDVGVEVKDGIVTLTGTVGSWAERMAGQLAAHRVAGVLDVANDIQVKLPGPAGRTDSDIAAAVRHTLEWDVFVPEKNIRSTVSKGWVTLEGEVDTYLQSQAAERAVRNLAGVAVVVNKLEIKPSAFAGDVRRSIEDALERRALREASHIAVTVEGGRVSVTGTVRTWDEKQAVLGAARGTPGVRGIDDHLRISWSAG